MMSRLLFCVLAFCSLSACADQSANYSTIHYNEANVAMLSVENDGYEMTSLYHPVVYTEAFQKSPYPTTRRMTLNYIIKASSFRD